MFAIWFQPIGCRQTAPIAESNSTKLLDILKRLPSVVDLADVKIFNFGHRERFADFCHPLFPLAFADHRNLFDLAAMRRGKFRIVPQSVHVPSVEIMKPNKHFQFPLLYFTKVSIRFVLSIGCAPRR